MTKNSNNGCIFGIHVAGDSASSEGIAACVSRESVEELLSVVEDDDKIEVEFEGVHPLGPEPKGDSFKEQMLIQQYPTQFDAFYCLATPLSVGGRSTIARTKLFELWGPAKKRPARLNPFKDEDGRIVDPYLISIQPYGVNFDRVSEPDDRIDLITSTYLEWMVSEQRFVVDKRLLTFEEAVKGVDGEPELKAINRKTSAGFPFSANPIFKGDGKSAIFGSGDVMDLNTPASDLVRKRVDQVLLDAAHGKRSFHCYTDFSKDELRTKEKSKKGKTRLISGGPVDLLICFSIMFGSFIIWYKKNRLYNGSGIGINPYGSEWHLMASKLLSNAGSLAAFGAGDFHHFDGSEAQEIMTYIVDMVNKWYDDGPINALIRRILFLEIYNSRHIRCDLIYEWFGGMPSGTALTSIVNTIYVNIVFRYAWCKLYGFTRRVLFAFCIHVYLVAFGDDNVFSVSGKYLSEFTETVLAEQLAKIGLDYTSETKDGTNDVLRPLGKVSFLKRGFKKSESTGRYIAPLELDTILESPYWHDRDVVREADLVSQRVQNSVEELSLHGSAVFERYAPLMISALHVHYGVRLPRTSYLTCLEYVSTRDSAWARDF